MEVPRAGEELFVRLSGSDFFGWEDCFVLGDVAVGEVVNIVTV